MYTTRTTWLGNRYGCRVYYNDVLILEGQCYNRNLIGAVYRDLFRTLDKLGGDQFTSASRKRKFKDGNPVISVKHIWYR